MKWAGAILIILGIILLSYLIFLFIKDRNQLLSPIPEEEGIKVIFITPTQQ